MARVDLHLAFTVILVKPAIRGTDAVTIHLFSLLVSVKTCFSKLRMKSCIGFMFACTPCSGERQDSLRLLRMCMHAKCPQRVAFPLLQVWADGSSYEGSWFQGWKCDS